MPYQFDAKQVDDIVQQYNFERLQQIDILGNAILATLKANCALLSAEEIVGVLENVKFTILQDKANSRND
jgi:hypothetical protein